MNPQLNLAVELMRLAIRDLEIAVTLAKAHRDDMDEHVDAEVMDAAGQLGELGMRLQGLVLSDEPAEAAGAAK